MITLGVLILGVATARSMFTLAPAMAIVGALLDLVMIASTTATQHAVAPDLLGRVAALQGVAAALGALPAAVLAELGDRMAGAPGALASAAPVALFAGAAVLARRPRQLRVSRERR